jgi:hypothetical protein
VLLLLYHCVYKIFIYVYIGSDLPVIEPQVRILDLHRMNIKCRGEIVSRSAFCLTKSLNKVYLYGLIS